MTKLLELRDLQAHFFTSRGTVKAVGGVSYDIEEGETLAVVGESGCGKSATALSIMRLVPPPGKTVGGEILFEGADLLEKDDKEMQRIRGKDIAMIFQEPMTSLNPVLSIGRQITEAMEVHLGTSPKAARARAIELLELVQISEPEQRLKQYPHQFSGGMRQRVMLAMALACSPKLILADEPTTALDVTVQAQILAMMKQLSRQFGAAMILITHNLGVVARYADRVAVMYAGKVVEYGPAEEIFGDPRHPYTMGLMRSVPRIDRVRPERLNSIAGQPPDLASLASGCSFRARCSYALDKCATEEPSLFPLGPRHASACWVAEELGT